MLFNTLKNYLWEAFDFSIFINFIEKAQIITKFKYVANADYIVYFLFKACIVFKQKGIKNSSTSFGSIQGWKCWIGLKCALIFLPVSDSKQCKLKKYSK